MTRRMKNPLTKKMNPGVEEKMNPGVEEKMIKSPMLQPVGMKRRMSLAPRI